MGILFFTSPPLAQIRPLSHLCWKPLLVYPLPSWKPLRVYTPTTHLTHSPTLSTSPTLPTSNNSGGSPHENPAT
jgi:hypothetical protein